MIHSMRDSLTNFTLFFSTVGMKSVKCDNTADNSGGVAMWGLSKKRSKVGKFLDKHGKSQRELSEVSGVSEHTIGKVCNDPSYLPTGNTVKKIMKALRKLDSSVNTDDFFNI